MNITTIAHPNQACLEELISKMRDQHRLMGQVIDCLDHKVNLDLNEDLPKTHREAYDTIQSAGLGAMRPALRLAELLAMWEPIAGCQSGPLTIPALFVQDGDILILIPEASYDLFSREIEPMIAQSLQAQQTNYTIEIACDETAEDLAHTEPPCSDDDFGFVL